jgi:hypothetical protein
LLDRARSPLLADTVEKLDFLPRSQFLKQQASFKKKALRGGSPRLVVPDNIVLLPLPPYAPELNSTENIWEYLRGNCLSHCVWDTYEAILDACCDAWNALMATPDVIASIGTRKWAQVRI